VAPFLAYPVFYWLSSCNSVAVFIHIIVFMVLVNHVSIAAAAGFERSQSSIAADEELLEMMNNLMDCLNNSSTCE